VEFAGGGAVGGGWFGRQVSRSRTGCGQAG
jgi:hypothetical protein